MTSTTMGEKPEPWPVLETSRNRKLSRRAILAQPSLEETSALPVPAHIPGQLSLWRSAADEEKPAEFITWRCGGQPKEREHGT